MFDHFPIPCAIVDLETTGCNVTYDRIIEVGIVEVTEDGVSEWSTLVNPRVRISESIQRVTGISNEMVESAPYFEQVAKEILLRLQGKLFIAHNVRFDYGFIRNEYARLAYSFKAKLMCTVKLSRYLYPEYEGHSLEKIIHRFNIKVADRHRALEDAKATYKFMVIAETAHDKEKIEAAVKHQYRKESIPAGFDAGLLEGLPSSPGVYYFWGDGKQLLYVGKSINIRKRVLSHFTADHKSSREMKICQQTRNITFDTTAGELSALILGSKKVKELRPLYNRKLRRVSTFYSIYLEEQTDGLLTPKIVPVSEMPNSRTKMYGLFPSIKKAKAVVQALSDTHGLCYQACGLEQSSNRACSSHQLKKCGGYCVGKMSPLVHNVKVIQGFSSVALKTWPYKGPVAIIEDSKSDMPNRYLVVDNWCLLGETDDLSEFATAARTDLTPEIDRDIYRYLIAAISASNSSVRIVALPNATGWPPID